MKQICLSVIIPVYNEEDGIGKVVERLKKTLSADSINYEIIVVDDASTDDTKKILLQLEGIKLINNPFNLGYGASIKNGIKNAKYDIVAIIDGDNTYPAEKIVELLNHIEDCDMLIGKRKKIIYSRFNWLKQIGRFFISSMASFFSGVWIPDINSGMRVFKKEIVSRFAKELCDRFSFTTSLTLLALFHRYKLKYIPIEYCCETNSNRKSKVHLWRDGMRTSFLILKLGICYAPIKIVFLILILILIFILCGI